MIRRSLEKFCRPGNDRAKREARRANFLDLGCSLESDIVTRVVEALDMVCRNDGDSSRGFVWWMPRDCRRTWVDGR